MSTNNKTNEKDLEEDKPLIQSETKLVDEAPMQTQVFWLVVWMANNILVTMLNKAAFAKVNFNYQYALSTIHMACNIIGSQIYFLLSRTVKPKQIEGTQRTNILLFSVIFSLNIAIGNTSLSYVSVNFNQVVRSLVPVIVLFISIVWYRKVYSSARKWAVLPIAVGKSIIHFELCMN